jgi:hypothetical protein
MVLKRSDSAGSLSARWAILPEHFHLAAVSIQVSPDAPFCRLVPSGNRQASRKVLQWAKRQPLWKASRRAGLVEQGFSAVPAHWAKRLEKRLPWASPRQV